MFSKRLLIRLIIPLVWGALAANALEPGPLPLEKGMQWTYEGKVQWTVGNSARSFAGLALRAEARQDRGQDLDRGQVQAQVRGLGQDRGLGRARVREPVPVPERVRVQVRGLVEEQAPVRVQALGRVRVRVQVRGRLGRERNGVRDRVGGGIRRAAGSAPGRP
jgi:hypothetical protein